jgi:hypothetical protein
MPHPGHLCVARDCRFHLATFIPVSPRLASGEIIVPGVTSGIIVSTVGEYLPEGPMRETLAELRGIQLEGRGDARLDDYMRKIGWEEIGAGRLYETMVFAARPRCDGECDGCAWMQANGMEMDFAGYNDAEAAYRGHLEICERWARRMDDDSSDRS